VAALDDSELDIVTNCAPWTVRQLASNALNNQLLWPGLVRGEETVTVEETMGAVAYDGDLGSYADEVAERSLAIWPTPGVLTVLHATPFGELPGSVAGYALTPPGCQECSSHSAAFGLLWRPLRRRRASPGDRRRSQPRK
jgi:hypothetical protein